MTSQQCDRQKKIEDTYRWKQLEKVPVSGESEFVFMTLDALRYANNSSTTVCTNIHTVSIKW